jgi:hypothetical protein
MKLKQLSLVTLASKTKVSLRGRDETKFPSPPLPTLPSHSPPLPPTHSRSRTRSSRPSWTSPTPRPWRTS